MRRVRGSATVSALVGFCAALACPLPPALGQVTNPITPGTITARLQPFVTIPSANGEPLDLTFAPGDASRVFVATHGGQVRLVNDGTLQPTSFLDLQGRGVTILGGSGNDERGLLGLAFHPNFNAAIGTPGRGKFYTYTSEPKSGNADFTHPEIGPTGGDHQSVIREWSVDPTNPNVADPNTAPRILMRIAEPQANHNGGAMKFDAAGNLYISLGDGGGANDFFGSANSTTDGHTNTTGNGQDTTNVYGKILRINPTGTGSVNGQYGIPAGNPFAAGSTSAVKEILVYGLRNPFRISIDRANGNNLYIGDVGQGSREEVDMVSLTGVSTGSNYGWPYLEGTADNTNYSQTGAGTLAPIGEYTHGDGISIIGGFVYRGSVFPALQGKYVFGDLSRNGVGRLFYIDAAGGPISEFQYDTAGGGVAPSAALYGFGENASGELYALFSNGSVLQIAPEPGVWFILPTIATIIGLRRTRRRGSNP